MKIFFSSQYDKEVYREHLDFNVKYIGELGLLNVLERELGLYNIYQSDNKRAEIYLKCLENCKQDSFYEKSLESEKDGVNKLLVAKELLSYRDQLVIFNWNPNENQEGRLSDFKRIEFEFKNAPGFEGISDRWRNVINSLTKDKIKQFTIKAIELNDPQEYLPQHLTIIFEKISSVITCKYNEVSLKTNTQENNLELFKKVLFESIIHNKAKKSNSLNSHENDSSLVVLNFKDRQLLHDTIAKITDIKDSIIINKDNSAFDYSLVSFGKSASGSKQIDALPQITQLPKLIISCFSKNINLANVVSFLDLPKSPLDSKLCFYLKQNLVKSPGFYNEEWNTIIEAFNGTLINKDLLSDKEKRLVNSFKTEDATGDKLKERQKQIDLFLSFKNEDEKKSLNKAKNIFRHISEWAKKMFKSKSTLEIKEQFNYVQRVSKAILGYDFNSGTIEGLEAKIKLECEKQYFTNYFKQKGSLNVSGHIGAITTLTNKSVYWLDFQFEKPKRLGDFLLKSEINSIGGFYKSKNEYNLELVQCLRGLLNIEEKLILCTVDNKETEKHPLHLRLETLFDKESYNQITLDVKTLNDEKVLNFLEITKEDLHSPKQISIPQPKTYFESDLLNQVMPRSKESASSIEKFIEYPFDWVMQYITIFSNDIGFKLPDDNLIKGNVAHKVIETLFTQYPQLDFSEQQRDDAFIKVLNEIGVVFLQKEKRLDLNEFRYRFNKALNTLVSFIKENNLTVKACEYSFGKNDDCYIQEVQNNVSGYIDLYLSDEHQMPFVIDLKWSYSDKKYKAKIKNEEAIQLGVYSAAIESRKNCKTAYFMTSQNLFITKEDNLKGNNIYITKPEDTATSVLEKLANSYQERWQELNEGKLEIGDDYSLEALDYHQRSKEGCLISLPEDNKKLKKVYPYSGYKLFKGQLK